MVNNSVHVTMCPVVECDAPLFYKEGDEHPYCEIHGVIDLSLFVRTTITSPDRQQCVGT